jgi:uncharacterized protein YkwD
MRRIAVLAACLVLAPAASAGRPDPPSPAAAGTADNQAAPTSVQISSVASLEHDLLGAINDVRTRRGLTPLRLNRTLTAVAREHSRSMAEHGFFRHASLDGAPFWRRIKPVFRPVPGRTWGAGENIVWQSPDLTAADAIQRWLNSPPHRKNLLTPSWREIGIGGVHALSAPGVYDGLDVTIVTTDFGVR